MEWVAISYFRNLPDPGIKSMFLESPALASGLSTTSNTWEAQCYAKIMKLRRWGGSTQQKTLFPVEKKGEEEKEALEEKSRNH